MRGCIGAMSASLGIWGGFFRGAPTGIVIDFTSTRQFANADRPEAVRVGFITDKSILLPGKKIDIVQIWTAGKGWEVTYKGRTELPKDQVTDYFRRQEPLDRSSGRYVGEGAGRGDRL